jgi:hypothetical protein
MEAVDRINLRGSLEISLKDTSGKELEHRSIQNVVVTVGRRWVLQQLETLDQQTAQTISHLAVGTSTTAPATGDTALGSENTRKAIGTFSTANLTSNPPSWQAQVSFNTNEANTTLGEVGLFQSSSGGTLFARATFATINKTTSNTLSISYTISN